MKRCPHCNQPIPPRELPEGVHLTPTRLRIWEAVTRWPGMSTREVMSFVYGHDPNGGPDSTNIIQVNVSVMNKQLRQHGIEITGRHGYHIRQLLEGRTI